MTLSAGCQQFLDWARSLPSTGAEARAYREPAFEGARAPSKAEAQARELQDARESLTKARTAPAVPASWYELSARVQAVVRAGDASASPSDSDLVLCHLSLRTTDKEERLFFSTRAEEGGRGVPLRSPLGEGCSLLRGVELALAVFTRGERAVLRLPPEFAYGASRLVQRRRSWRLTRALRRPRVLRSSRAVAAARRLRQARTLRGG